MKLESTTTFLDAVVRSLLAASDYNKNDQVQPAVVLWPDKDQQWAPVVQRLREKQGRFLTYGSYDKAARTGPAIWLRCMLAQSLPGETYWPAATVPVVYLPGIGRQELRTVEECPKPLEPLIECQYRGVYWSRTAKDWTVLAFLSSEDGGLGLDIAKDAGTLEAMRRALPKLLDTPITELKGKRLEAVDFQALLTPDPVRDLLGWMNDTKGTRSRWEENVWQSFRSVCKKNYGFDPEKDGELAAGEQLGNRQGSWDAVWERFAESPKRYPKLPELLRKSKPEIASNLFVRRESWPQFNEEMELVLRSELLGLRTIKPAEAAAKIESLETEHGIRRKWVWAELGSAPLAQSLEYLSELAKACAKPLGGASPDEMSDNYAGGAWRADWLALAATADVEHPKDAEAVGAAINAVYRPWLEAAAERFQKLVKDKPWPAGPKNAKLITASDGTCILFADGLRFDVAQKLREFLATNGWQIEQGARWVALPSVTPTAKPAVSPVADLLSGTAASDDFRPNVTESGKPLTIDRFRQMLEDRGYQVLQGEDVGDPDGKAWAEYGQIDSYGHGHGWKLAQQVEREIRGLVVRIGALLAAGWKQVKVVTDHGWLLLPGGLPKTEMPSYLVETRWGRCAVLKPGSKVDGPTMLWHWCEEVGIATPPGIGSFKAGQEYSHGGLTIQECLVATLVVSSGAGVKLNAKIQSLKWLGLRCRVAVDGEFSGCKVDIRSKVADAASSMVKAEAVAANGTASVLVDDDKHVGAAAVIVLLSPDGQVVAKKPTTVGGEE